MRSKIVPAKPEHLIDLVERLRGVEMIGFYKIGEQEYEKALMSALSKSVAAFTGFFDDRPVAVWGAMAGGVFSDEAQIWMLGSREIEQHPIVFARHSREALQLTLQFFKRPYGYVLTDFSCGVRWLEWLGFSVGPPEGLVRRFEWTQ